VWVLSHRELPLGLTAPRGGAAPPFAWAFRGLDAWTRLEQGERQRLELARGQPIDPGLRLVVSLRNASLSPHRPAMPDAATAVGAPHPAPAEVAQVAQVAAVADIRGAEALVILERWVRHDWSTRGPWNEVQGTARDEVLLLRMLGPGELAVARVWAELFERLFDHLDHWHAKRGAPGSALQPPLGLSPAALGELRAKKSLAPLAPEALAAWIDGLAGLAGFAPFERDRGHFFEPLKRELAEGLAAFLRAAAAGGEPVALLAL
jgi:hypothetical protein